jgi:hypothetical protein
VINESTQARFWAKVSLQSGCWPWTAYIAPTGYGMFCLNRRMTYAHRVAYEIVNGPIPEGLQIDHLCRVRHCVNPAHLEAVTQRENMARGAAGPAGGPRRTTCKRGHDLTDPANIYTRRDGGHMCHPCHLDRARAQTAKKVTA